MTIRHAAAILLCLLPGENAAFGYAMREEFSLDELEKAADVVFKGTVVSSAPDRAAGDQKTQFKIVSVVKGADPGATVTFRHLDQSPDDSQFFDGPPPIHYHFETGKTYLVFAEATDAPGVYGALWRMPQSEGNQGVFLCASNAAAASTLKDEVWDELTGLLQRSDNSDILYAIQQLDQLSGDGWGGESPRYFGSTLDFDRKAVLDAVHSFVASSDPKVAHAAITTVGSHNPYLTQERAEFWLATVGSAERPWLGKMDPKVKNLGAELYGDDLITVADGKADAGTRALAIRGLGLVNTDAVAKHLEIWLGDPAPEVRAAATVLHADYPVPANSDLLAKLSADPSPEVRIATAQCVGFGQQKVHVDVLGKLLTDSDAKVRQAAAMNVLSFSPRDPAVEGIFKLHSSDEEFAPLFTLALAREDPAPYRDELLWAMAQPMNMPTPSNGWGGQVPSYTARDILFKYLRTQPADKLKSGEFDRYLDAMDRAALANMGSPLEIYSFYIRHGLTARAEAIRQAALKAFPYQQAISYDQAAEHPEIYDQ